MKTSLLRLVLAALAVLWIFVVVLNYYIVHKPFGIENILALLNAAGDVFVALLLALVAAAFGHFMLRRLHFSEPLEALIFETGLGFGMMSFAVLTLGVFGLTQAVIFWGGVLVALILLRHDVRGVLQQIHIIQLGPLTRWTRGLMLFAGFVLVLAGLYALLPPTAWDAQTYHLVKAQAILAQGRLVAPPDIPYFSFPSLGEMLFLAAMALKSDIAAQWIHLIFLVLLLGGILAYTRRYFNLAVGWLAVAMLAAVPSLVALATWAYVDALLMFYAFAAFYALARAGETEDWRWIALAGACAGLAMGTKYTALIVPVALFFVLLARRDWDVKRWLVFGGACALFAAPWFLRNLAFTGNPIYPFFFGGANWDAFRGEWFSRFGSGLLNEPLRLGLAPWEASIVGREGTLSYDATIGPLLLAILPLLLIGVVVRTTDSAAIASSDAGARPREERRPLGALLIFAGILYLFWLAGVAGSKLLLQTRLLFPAFPPLALAAAYGFEQLRWLDLRQFSAYRFAQLVVTLVLALAALSYALAFMSGDALAYLAGAKTRTQYLAAALGEYYDATQFMNEQLPPDARVMFLWEPRVYYVHRAAQPDSILDRWAHDHWKYKDVNTLAQEWRRAGFTHVLLSRAGLNYLLQTGFDPLTPEDVRGLQEFEQKHLRVIYQAPLGLTTNDGKPALSNADIQQYAIYELVNTK